MYLKKIPAARRPPTIAVVNRKNGVVRWHEGAPGCDHFVSNGILVESLTISGVTVQVSLHDTGWKLRANVAVANESSESISIEPSKFILDEIGPNGRPLFYQDPAELAKSVTHQVLWTESVAEPSRALDGSRSWRSEEHTSELQSRQYLVCRLLLETKHMIVT